MGPFLRVALCRMFVFVRPGRQRKGTRSARRPALRAVLTKVLTLQVELCLPKLVSSPAPGGLDRRTSGFQPESWPQGQSIQSTPLSAGPGRVAALRAYERAGAWIRPRTAPAHAGAGERVNHTGAGRPSPPAQKGKAARLSRAYRSRSRVRPCAKAAATSDWVAAICDVVGVDARIDRCRVVRSR